MKKLGLVLVLVAFVASGVFAQFAMSFGAGGILDMSLGNGYEYNITEKTTVAFDNTSFGGFVFFDITYAEIELDYLYGTIGNTVNGKDQGKTFSGVFNQLGIGIMGKYPIDLGIMTLFPMIGINYNMVSSYEIDGKEYSKVTGADLKSYTISEYFSQLGILAGVGADFTLTDQLFLRAEVQFHLRLPSKRQEIFTDVAKKFDDNAVSTLGAGPRIKIGVGYKL